MRFEVLGPVRVLRDGEELGLGPRKQRALLTALLLTPDRPVPTDRIVDLLWGDRPPPAVTASLHGYVAGLRRVLEPGRDARARPTLLLTDDVGYRVRLAGHELDLTAFRDALDAAHAVLAGPDPYGVPPALGVEALTTLADRLEAALGRWRGEPLEELGHAPDAEAEREHLQTLRTTAALDLARVRLAQGRPQHAVAVLAPLASRHPLREDLRAAHALALVRADRQAEALAELRALRDVLADELGVDPSPAVQDLQTAILRQEPGLFRSSSVPASSSRSARGPRPTRNVGSLVGREPESAALDALLDQVLADGVVRAVSLVGEPGIGKTRLAGAVAGRATERGFTVLTGGCSQDEGAPPLWPWTAVVHDLGTAHPDLAGPGVEDPGAFLVDGPDAFVRHEALCALLVRAARRTPLLLVLEDLHWADASSLRLLRHLLTGRGDAAVLVLLTRRATPEPEGALAELTETLARRGDPRLDLGGLAGAALLELAVDVGRPLDPGGVDALRDRTGGNPFFVLELLRLAATQPDVLTGDRVPAVVSDVIAARVGTLPESVRQVLQVASVLGRTPDLTLLAGILGRDPSDDLDVAAAAGVVEIGEDGSVRFRHALVRDAVYAGVRPLRRQRWHAEAAERLTAAGPPGRRLAELAGHELRGGPARVGQAWRAAAAAAAYATTADAHEEAADLLGAAVDRQRLDDAATPEQRYHLLLARVDACRRAADTEGQTEAAAAAVELASTTGDLELLAGAAVAGSEGGLWSNRVRGEAHGGLVSALRRASEGLPRDSPLRCRTYLALSRELYWAEHRQERDAYAEQGLAMARRLRDPRLLGAACRTVFMAVMRPETLALRTGLAAEAVQAAGAAGDAEGEVVGLFWQGLAATEAGRMAERRMVLDEAAAIAGERRLRYLQVMIGTFQVGLLALEGDLDEADALLQRCTRWAAAATFPFRDEALAGARLVLDVWRDRAGDLLPHLLALDEVSPVDLSATVSFLLLRAHEPERLREHLRRHPLPMTPASFDTLSDLAVVAETALVLERPDLASAAYPRLLPWSGRMVSAGTGLPLGPVDAFLALSAAAAGERGQAGRHAAEAERLCRDWGQSSVAGWFAAHRAAQAF